MNASESLGPLGWGLIGLLVVAAVISVTVGFSKVFYLALILVPVVFVVLINLCGGERPDAA